MSVTSVPMRLAWDSSGNLGYGQPTAVAVAQANVDDPASVSRALWDEALTAAIESLGAAASREVSANPQLPPLNEVTEHPER